MYNRYNVTWPIEQVIGMSVFALQLLSGTLLLLQNAFYLIAIIALIKYLRK